VALASVFGIGAVCLVRLGASAAGGRSVPRFDHIFTIVMENHNYDEVVGNTSQAPYLNGLVSRYGLATNYSAVSHPSLPNYLALTGGSTFGISDDCTGCFQSRPNIAVDRIEASGRSWKSYQESIPSPGFVGDAYPYMQKHDPLIYFDDVRNNPAEAAKIVPYANLSSDLASEAATPNYVWITPNMCSDTHDCPISTGDQWLSRAVPAILASPAYRNQNSALFITWDEDDNGNNQVATVLVAKSVPPGFRSGVAYDHYSLLKTIESSWGLAPLTGNDSAAAPMSDFFASTPSPTPSPTPTPTPTPSPSPTPTPQPSPTPTPTPGGTPVAGGTVFASDTFAGRSASGGWGTASDGQDWSVQSGDASLLSVSAAAGGHGLVSGSNSMDLLRATLGSVPAAGTEVVARYTSADYHNDCGHLLASFSGDGSYYVAGLDSPYGAPELNVMKVVGGTQSRVAHVAFPAVDGTAYWERIRIQGGVVSVKAWKDGTAEPSSWNLTWTDHSPLPGGLAGVESWDDGQGWAIDHFSAGSLS
jgi:acid phosphatase